MSKSIEDQVRAIIKTLALEVRMGPPRKECDQREDEAVAALMRLVERAIKERKEQERQRQSDEYTASQFRLLARESQG